MSLEVVSNVKFINVYLVRRVYSLSSGICYPYTSPPPTLVEAYLSEGEAVQRVEQLENIQDKFPHTSDISMRKHLGVTCDDGKTVSLIDALSTFTVSSIA